jgi:hypothetical protein
MEIDSDWNRFFAELEGFRFLFTTPHIRYSFVLEIFYVCSVNIAGQWFIAGSRLENEVSKVAWRVGECVVGVGFVVAQDLLFPWPPPDQFFDRDHAGLVIEDAGEVKRGERVFSLTCMTLGKATAS